MKARHKRLSLLAAGLLLLGAAATLVVGALRENLVFFYTPTQVAGGKAPRQGEFRVGGMVETGSLQRDGQDMLVRFIVTDHGQRIPVVYRGILPDLFREGRGVVAQGRLDADGSFRAEQVLAKHDENYMPPEAREALAQGEAATRQRTVQGP